MVKNIFKKTKKSFPSRKNFQAGFTLLEMAMVLTIFGLLTAVVSYNYGAFNNQIVLGNLAYEVGMQIREAQVFSLGVRGTNNNFKTRHGVYFQAGAGTFNSFIDLDLPPGVNKGICDDCVSCPGGGECYKVIDLPRNMKIDRILSGTDPITDPVSITFERPNPEAIITVDNGSNPLTVLTTVDIVLRSPDNQYKKIIVRENGFISIDDYTP